MRTRVGILAISLALAASADAQQLAPPTISETQPPPASLWERYSYEVHAEGGIAPYHWVIGNGPLPRGLSLDDSGEIRGVPEDAGVFDRVIIVRDSENPPKEALAKFVLTVEPPMSAEWNPTAHVQGQRIEGGIKVSNRTGRDLDLTFVTLAVNEIGRATAIGYQHFSLKPHTVDMNIPFGDTLSPGMYAVNVDVVGEEPISNQIFRTRLVKEKEQVGP